MSNICTWQVRMQNRNAENLCLLILKQFQLIIILIVSFNYHSTSHVKLYLYQIKMIINNNLKIMYIWYNETKIILRNIGLRFLFFTGTKFLAAMSSSRSDKVTNSISVSVGSHFVQFGAFIAFEARCFEGVARVSQGRLFKVSRVL